jgi:hypothetical protein
LYDLYRLFAIFARRKYNTMKNRILHLAVYALVGSLVLGGCKKDDTGSKADTNPCGDKNFCFKVGDDLSFAFDAKWIAQAQSKYKVLFTQSLGGTSNETAELEFKADGGIRTGDFTFASTITTDGQAYFRYIKNISGEITQFICSEGTLKITKFENSQITGTFTCQAKDKENKTVSLKSGNVFKVGN